MKTATTPITTIDAYLKGYPAHTQALLGQIRSLVHTLAPEATEAIGYGIPTFKLNGNLVHFAGYEHHVGFYPGAQAIEVFKDKLTKYNCSKGTIQFPLDAPLPLELIREIVEFRLTQQRAKSK